MINDSPLKQSFYSFRDEIGLPRSFSAAGIAYTLTVSTLKMGVYTVETEIKLLLRNRYDQVLQSYYSICAFRKHYTLVYREQQPAGLQAELGFSVHCCFLLVSSMLSLPIPFLLCPGDGSMYEILRDSQLTNQPFRGFNLNNSKSYSFPDFLDISFNFYIVLPGIETVKFVCVCACVRACVRVCVRACVYVRNIQRHCF